MTDDAAPAYDDFVRYLAAKRTVDDRALNRPVWNDMAAFLNDRPQAAILEVGAGIGTMVERLAAAGLVGEGAYTAIDAAATNIEAASERLAPLGLDLTLEAADLYAFAARETGRRQWDLLIAHAVLDLLHLETALDRLLPLVATGGHLWLTINFDGVTAFEPPVDLALDAWIEHLYHETMDTRLTNGQPSGDSRTGRRLLPALRRQGVAVVNAGPSDWVVWAGPDGYPADEAYFLHFIVSTVGRALQGHEALAPADLARWLAARHAQIAAGELVYVAHQLDVLARI